MRNKLLFLVAGSVLSAGSLAACGDDDTDASSAPDDTVATSAPDEAVITEVTIEGSRFLPGELTVAPGTEVVFENLDLATHTVTSADDSPLAFDSGSLGEGDVFTQIFDDPGTYDYFCEVHPTMRASVVVDD